MKGETNSKACAEKRKQESDVVSNESEGEEIRETIDKGK